MERSGETIILTPNEALLQQKEAWYKSNYSMWQVKVFVITTPVLADLKQLLVSNVCRNKATAELENTSAVAEAAAGGITWKLVKKSAGNLQKRSDDVSFSELLIVGFCST